MKSIAIMQPTYLPWYGYFALMDYVDIFVCLNDVQFEKRSWQSRNFIKAKNNKLMLSANVKSKKRFDQMIKDVELINYEIFSKKHLKAIELNYKKTKYFENFFSSLENNYKNNFTHLEKLNLSFIYLIMNFLNIKKKIIFSSELNIKNKNLKKDSYLLEICKNLSADTFISAEGSRGYLQESQIFEQSSVKVNYFSMKNFVYNQLYGNFISNLSTIDIIFNEGAATQSILRKNFLLNE